MCENQLLYMNLVHSVKAKNNPLLSAETGRHSSTYIILYVCHPQLTQESATKTLCIDKYMCAEHEMSIHVSISNLISPECEYLGHEKDAMWAWYYAVIRNSS